MPACFLLQNSLCSGQHSDWERADCPAWSPSLEVSREWPDTALRALVCLRRWESLTAWIPWPWRTFPTSMSPYFSYLSFWIMFLIFSFYMILQLLSRLKKILLLFSPTIKTLSLFVLLLLFHYSEQRHSFETSFWTPTRCSLIPGLTKASQGEGFHPLPSWWKFSIKMPARAPKALSSLLFLSWTENNICLRPPDPESDGALPLKELKIPRLFHFFWASSLQEKEIVTSRSLFPFLHWPSLPPPVLFFQSCSPTAHRFQDLEVIPLKRSSGLQSHTNSSGSRAHEPQKNTELRDPQCQHWFPDVMVLQLYQQAGRTQKPMESQSQNGLGWKGA